MCIKVEVPRAVPRYEEVPKINNRSRDPDHAAFNPYIPNSVPIVHVAWSCVK